MVPANPQNKPWTYDDLLALPDDGKRYELIDGEVLELLTPLYIHQYIVSVLDRLLGEFATKHKLGLFSVAPMDVRLSDHNIVQPDLVFLSREKRHLIQLGRVAVINGVPDLVIEILSPSNPGYDLVRKATLYMTYGVREYWIVDPETQSILVQFLEEGRSVNLPQPDGIVRSRALEGFEFDPKGRFQLPDWFVDGETSDN